MESLVAQIDAAQASLLAAQASQWRGTTARLYQQAWQERQAELSMLEQLIAQLDFCRWQLRQRL